MEELNQFYEVLHNSEGMANTGISHFIREKNPMEMKRFQEAYCSFGRVSDSPGYNEKAVEYQTKAIMNFTDIEAVEFGSSPTASTHTLFNSNNSDLFSIYSMYLKVAFFLIQGVYCDPVPSLYTHNSPDGCLGSV